MKNSVARFREAGSFNAGILIGVSIVVLVFASIGANTSDWQTLLVFGSPIIVILGVTLQVVTTAKPRHERMIITDRRPSSGFEDVNTTKPGILRSARPRGVAHVAAIFDAGGAI